MNYTARYKYLNELFSLEKENTEIKKSGIRIQNLEFSSKFPANQEKNQDISSFGFEDLKINENWNFRYPVFNPVKQKNDKAIVLLHGLNEREWNKYLPWGEFLAKKTKRTVIFFPLAFHVNRGKKEWSDPRMMSKLAESRKNNNVNIYQSSFVNAALSNRLSEDPMRFYRAGLQSAHDLIQLLNEIRDGNLPLLMKNSEVNFFGYSIGAFLTQIMFMANPGNLFGKSKAVLFCGGTTFNNMFGTSKLIMDNLAYEKLNNFYTTKFENEPLPGNRSCFSRYLSSVINSFKAMIPVPGLNNIRNFLLSTQQKRILAIGLLKDKVIPAFHIRDTLTQNYRNKNPKLVITDFPYDYTHENPFPVNNLMLQPLVDNSFEQLFSRICVILK